MCEHQGKGRWRGLKSIMDVEIEYLADRIDVLPTLAAWHHEQWGYLNPQNTISGRAKKLRRRSQKGKIPTTFVGFVRGQPIGSASLVENDLPTRPDLYPWLASVYVAPKWRRRGLGTQLVQRVILETGELGFGRLYLITPNQVAWYRSLGWSMIARFPHRNEQVALMERVVLMGESI